MVKSSVPSRPTVTVVYDYEPRTPTELAIKKGETLQVIVRDDAAQTEWIEVINGQGKQGWVPKAYVL